MPRPARHRRPDACPLILLALLTSCSGRPLPSGERGSDASHTLDLAPLLPLDKICSGEPKFLVNGEPLPLATVETLSSYPAWAPHGFGFRFSSYPVHDRISVCELAVTSETDDQGPLTVQLDQDTSSWAPVISCFYYRVACPPGELCSSAAAYRGRDDGLRFTGWIHREISPRGHRRLALCARVDGRSLGQNVLYSGEIDPQQP